MKVIGKLLDFPGYSVLATPVPGVALPAFLGLLLSDRTEQQKGTEAALDGAASDGARQSQDSQFHAELVEMAEAEFGDGDVIDTIERSAVRGHKTVYR